jgi:phosphatidylethanolamine-binding protein (PEBP) family uncharacterized protein
MGIGTTSIAARTAGRRARVGAVLGVSLATLLVASGCGSSSGGSSSSRSAAQAGSTTSTTRSKLGEEPPPNERASIGVLTSAREAGGRVARQYTCKGANISPPLSWAGLPPETKEVLVVERTLQGGRLTTNWIVAGIRPPTHLLRPGRLPAGAVVGRNSFGKAGYYLCPPSGKGGLVVIGVYALPRTLGLHQGFAEREVIGYIIGNSGVPWGSTNLFLSS